MPKKDSVLEYLSEDERKSYEDYEKKLKAARDKAVRRHRAELEFWRKIDEREDEVYEHIILRRTVRQEAVQVQQQTEPQMPQEAGESRGGTAPFGEINL